MAPAAEESKSNRAVRLFESRLRKHKSVASFTKPDQTYVVRLIDGREVRAFLAIDDALVSILGYRDYLMDEQDRLMDEQAEAEASGMPMYTIGQADVMEILDYLGVGVNVDCIVSLSAYTWYTEQAQEVAGEFGVRLLTVKEFFLYLASDLVTRRIDQLKQLCAVISSIPVKGAYLFGSWQHEVDPADFDVLLVYDLGLCSIQEILRLKWKIRKVAPVIFGVPAHVVMLTTEEERQVNFIATNNCVLLDCGG
jgi:hypothetical protein